ncbi:transglycosylase domain-containing protein [Mobilicoccus pelagius]|uniref:transglycosylase domain-containing protein n=1 Tax=Mobilicoccus pelagius TaxID=746032 RepID=UPI0011468FA8|nr:transglycosylase domain-containing protein [Mobilicoccus pelagius]
MSSPTGRIRVVTPPRKRGWRRLFSIKAWLLVLSLGVLAVAAVVAVAYVLVDVPDPNSDARSQTSIVYFADGKTEMARISAVDREAVPLSEVPETMRHAILAAEDRSFYENPGISLTGIGRAVWAMVSGGPTQGGSTITQQYVKNYFLTQDQTFSRKGKELVISLKIEQELTKDEILRDYLNTIYFGRGAYGIQAASRAYFDKPASELDLAESAFLASVVRGPSLYDPANGAKAKKSVAARMDYVLDGMVEEGWLSTARRGRVRFPEVQDPKPRREKSGPNGYLVQMVKDELVAKVGLSPDEVDMGGLRITTTIDQQRQTDAIRAVENNLPTPRVRTGLVSLKPGDGAIMALYGGANATTQPYNAATQAQLQGGSTFKVFTLVAALEKGIATTSSYDGNSPRYFEAFKGGGNPSGRVQNYGDASLGWIDLRTATAKSANTVYAQLNVDVGPQRTVDAAVRMGLPQDTLGLDDNPANVFGTASPHVIDMAKAYATLAAGGVRAEPYIIRKVEPAEGVADSIDPYTAQPVTEQVLDKDVVADTVDAMRQVVLRGTAQKAQAIGRPAAGKTGTTDENRAVWFDGFTPDVATAVGMYLPDAQGNAVPMRGAGLGSGVTGGSYPVDVWTSYMRRAVEGTPYTDFPGRAGVGREDSPSEEETSAPEPSQPEQTEEWPSPTPTPEETTPGETWSPTDVPGDPATSDDGFGDEPGDGSQGGQGDPGGDPDQGGQGDAPAGDGGDAAGDAAGDGEGDAYGIAPPEDTTWWKREHAWGRPATREPAFAVLAASAT